MLISGFTFVRNAEKLDLPMREAIFSILPICDEFVVCVGQSDEGDHTKDIIESWNEPKIRIIDSIWDIEKWPKNTVYAQQTDIAKQACIGEWLFYIQCDEVIHEKYLDLIKEACLDFQDHKQVEGFLFNYQHFWGDYEHVQRSHGWYQLEIRIVRNTDNIWSWKDAQSFRVFDQKPESPKAYSESNQSRKLKVIELEAEVYHYGFVRPPHTMKMKVGRMAASYHGQDIKGEKEAYTSFDYGPLSLAFKFEGTHPLLMEERIKKMNWQEQLQYKGVPSKERVIHKHEKTKNRILTWVEQNLFGGRHILSFKNFEKIGYYDGR